MAGTGKCEITALKDQEGEQEEDEINQEEGPVEEAEAEDKEVEIYQQEGQMAVGEDKLMVLGPNHPKMQRFQKVLNEHLQKQLYNVLGEARDLDKELRDTQKERQETGSVLYNLQYELARQTDELTKLEKKLEAMAVRKIELDATASTKKKDLEGLTSTLTDEMRREETLIKAMKEIDVLEYCVRQAVEEFESEKKIQENIQDKIMKLRDEAEIEKRDQDYHLDKIANTVERMEQANAGIQRQIQAHLDEQVDLQAMISEANTEIEALHMEKKHLQRAWNETLAVIRARDEAMLAARNSLTEAKEHVRNREFEIRFLNREISKEQVKHEQASMLLKRREVENRKLTTQLDKLQGHIEQMEAQLMMLQNARAEMEAEYARTNNELIQKQRVLQKPMRKFDQLTAKKRELEDKILKDFQERTAMDKIAVNITKRIQKARVTTRDLEFQIVKLENEMTEVTANVEKLRTDVLKKTTDVEEMEKKMAQQEQLIQDQMNDMKVSEKLINRKTMELERMNRKLQKLVAERGSDSDHGPLEAEIDELEKQIVTARSQCVEMQEEWLKLQDTVVQLTQERELIANENELIQKEMFIIERKKQRLEQELEAKERGIVKMMKQIELTKAEVARLNAKQYQNELEESKLADQNNLVQTELALEIGEAENQVKDLENELEIVRQEQEMIEAVLTEAHEQCLVWEKKCRLLREVQKNIKYEQENANREIKLQIHHMQVRYGELQRVQERLMQDLEGTVQRRDTIIQKSERELLKSNANPERIKINMERNIKRIMERTQQMVDEVKRSELEAEATRHQIESLNQKLECEAAALHSLKEAIEQDEQKLIEAAISKHKYSVEISLRQKKYKLLESIHLSQFKSSSKGIESIQEHVTQLEQRCVAMAELCDQLLVQFPENGLQIKLIKASIYSHVK